MTYPAKGAIIRAIRTVFAITISTGLTALVAATPVALEGSSFYVFAGALTTAILGLDKYIRERMLVNGQ